MKLKRGSTSVRRLIFIADSASTVGAGLENLVYNTSSLVAYYFAGDLSNEVQITLATATLGTWTSGGFVAVDNTNMPGWYEIGIPNAALDGGNECAIQLRGAANMVPVNIYIELDSFDYQMATQPVNVTQFGGTNGTFNSGVPTAALDSAARVKLHGTQDDYAPLKSSDYTAPLTAAATRTALGMSAADLDTQLDAILAAASAGAGTGARLVTITVNDGTTVLQNAVVRLTEGGNTYRALTNVSGVATFNVDDATYAVAISKGGYSYAGTTIVVNGVETATYSMTAINVTPGSGDLTTGYLTCLDELGAAEASVAVRCQLVQVPSSGTGFAYDSTVQVETSSANGLVEFPMVKGCRYLIWRGSIKPPAGIVPVLISASAGSTTALGSLIGD